MACKRCMKQHEWKNPKWNKNEKGKFKKKEKEAANKGKIQNKQKHKRKQNMLTLNLKRHTLPQKMSLLAGNLVPRALFPGFHLQSQGKAPLGTRLVCGLSFSLRRRLNLSAVSNICGPVPRSLFWAPKKINESLDVYFEFPLQLYNWQMSNEIVLAKVVYQYVTSSAYIFLKLCQQLC